MPPRAGDRQKRGRLSRSAEFDRVYRDGRSYSDRFLVVYAFPREPESQVRLGISVGRKVGGAVERNAVKRALREAFDSLVSEVSSPSDVVVVARPDAAGLVEREGTKGVCEHLRELLGDAGVLAGDGPGEGSADEGDSDAGRSSARGRTEGGGAAT